MNRMLLLPAVLLFSACTVQIGGKADAPTTTTTSTTSTSSTTTSTTTTEPAPDPEDTYLQDVRLLTDLDLWYDDYTILDYGRSVCEFFDQGGDSEGMARIIYEAGLANGASEEVMLAFAGAAGLAVSNLCPEHSWKV